MEGIIINSMKWSLSAHFDGNNLSINGLKEGLHINEFWDNTSSERYYRNGLEDGPQRSYYTNKRLRYETYFQNGYAEGYGYFWYSDGTLNLKGFWKKGQQEGLYTIYHPNMKKYIEGHFKNSKKVGKWKRWDINGVLRKVRVFDDPLDRQMKFDDPLDRQMKFDGNNREG